MAKKRTRPRPHPNSLRGRVLAMLRDTRDRVETERDAALQKLRAARDELEANQAALKALNELPDDL